MIKVLGVALVGSLASAVTAGEYARPELLVDSVELFAHIEGRTTTFSDAGVVLVSVEPDAANGTASLRGAKRIDPGQWKAAFTRGESIDAWSRRLRGIVPNPDATVIVFDDGVTPNAARSWWLLRYWGLDDVRLLNMKAEGRYFCAAAIRHYGLPTVSPGAEPLVAEPREERLAIRSEVLGLTTVGRSPTCLIDTRSDTEVANGFIPTASHADWVRFVDPATGKMRSADELAELLAEAGFDPNRPAVAYCRSGGRASVVAFAMELMGGDQVANYFGSWNDWTSDPTSPVAQLGATAE